MLISFEVPDTWIYWVLIICGWAITLFISGCSLIILREIGEQFLKKCITFSKAKDLWEFANEYRKWNDAKREVSKEE